LLGIGVKQIHDSILGVKFTCWGEVCIFIVNDECSISKKYNKKAIILQDIFIFTKAGYMYF